MGEVSLDTGFQSSRKIGADPPPLDLLTGVWAPSAGGI